MSKWCLINSGLFLCCHVFPRILRLYLDYWFAHFLFYFVSFSPHVSWFKCHFLSLSVFPNFFLCTFVLHLLGKNRQRQEVELQNKTGNGQINNANREMRSTFETE